MKPLFSCVIPVKGKRPYMQDALDSLLEQGMTDDLEIIIQDADAELDLGQSDALNKGFAKALGEWFFWLNADDLLLPGALKKVVRCVEHAEWIAGNQFFVDDNGKVLRCSVGNRWHDWLYRHSVPHVYGPSSFFRRELFEKVGGFDASLHFCMDWDLWIKFMKHGAKFERINEYLWAQRQWEGSKTQRTVVGAELAKHWNEINEMLKKNSFHVTSGGIWLSRMWRGLNGNYLKEYIDGKKWKGRMLPI